jgi:hypothetical protein
MRKMGKVTVEQWVELFREIGLNDTDMKKWHRLFEEKNPQGHQSFLEWLGLDAKRIKEVRNL